MRSFGSGAGRAAAWAWGLRGRDVLMSGHLPRQDPATAAKRYAGAAGGPGVAPPQRGADVVVAEDEPHDAAVAGEGVVARVVGDQPGQGVEDQRAVQAGQAHDAAG